MKWKETALWRLKRLGADAPNQHLYVAHINIGFVSFSESVESCSWLNVKCARTLAHFDVHGHGHGPRPSREVPPVNAISN